MGSSHSVSQFSSGSLTGHDADILIHLSALIWKRPKSITQMFVMQGNRHRWKQKKPRDAKKI